MAAALSYIMKFLCLAACLAIGASTSGAEEKQASELETALLRALEKGPEAANQVAEIQAWMAPTFEALPKLERAPGRLGTRSSRHLLSTYFNAHFGWHIRGLEPHEMQRETRVKELDEVRIVAQRAPKLAKLLMKVNAAKTGMDLAEIAAYAAVLQRLVLRESKIVLKAAWKLQNHSANDDITWEEFQSVLHSSLLIMNDWSPDLLDDDLLKLGLPAEAHSFFGSVLERARNSSEAWARGAAFSAQVAERLRGDLADARQKVSYKTAQAAFFELFAGYGKYQNGDCIQMKAQLRGMDGRESGRVSLKSFYAAPEGSLFWFSESPKYLHKLGLLDNTNRHSPSVLVTNYVDSSTNCLAPAPFFSVCCISECGSVMAQIEAVVKAPTASAATLLSAVAEITRDGTQESRAMTPELVQRLHSIEQLSGGNIPLHGRLFAQWLHYVEPFKCAFPLEARAQVNWVQMNRIVDLKEKESYVETLGDAAPNTASDTIITQWSNEELLPLQDDPKDAEIMRREPASSGGALQSWSTTRRLVAHTVLLLGVVSLLVGLAQTALQGYRQRQLETELLKEESELTMSKTSSTKPAKAKGGAAVKKSLSCTTPAEKQQAPSQKPRRTQKATTKADAPEKEAPKPQAAEPAPVDVPAVVDEEDPSMEPQEAVVEAEAVAAEVETPALEISEKESLKETMEPVVAAAEEAEHAAQAAAAAAAAKAAAAAEAKAKAAAARAAAAEAAAAAAAAALAAEAAEAAAAEAQAEVQEEVQTEAQTDTQGIAEPDEEVLPALKPVPVGFEALQRVGLIGPSVPAARPVAKPPLPPGFRPPPGLEMFGPSSHGHF
eukprot:gb/GFBE01064547.1/.p1 GENE.gb/GFBE01064547.1/~~gb/GFBE01064547.1/.p1  ORF type:complete len:834 (+),score=236.79 gb/GFBE01064547.1/:1-2502(+)